jgi:hypothetical protein
MKLAPHQCYAIPTISILLVKKVADAWIISAQICVEGVVIQAPFLPITEQCLLGFTDNAKYMGDFVPPDISEYLDQWLNYCTEHSFQSVFKTSVEELAEVIHYIHEQGQTIKVVPDGTSQYWPQYACGVIFPMKGSECSPFGSPNISGGSAALN